MIPPPAAPVDVPVTPASSCGAAGVIAWPGSSGTKALVRSDSGSSPGRASPYGEPGAHWFRNGLSNICCIRSNGTSWPVMTCLNQSARRMRSVQLQASR